MSVKMSYNSFQFPGLGHCPICDNRGSKLILDSGNVDFEYPTSLLRFTIVSKLHVYIPHNFDGGIVLSLDQTNINYLYLTIQSLKHNVPVKVNQLSQALEIISKQRAIIIAKYSKIFESTLVMFERSLVRADFAIAREKLQNLKSATDGLRAHLKAVSEGLQENTRIMVLTRLLRSQLRQVDQVNFSLDSENITNIEQGQVISFDGSICLHELRFHDVNIKISDLPKSSFARCNTTCESKYSNSLDKNTVTIEVTSLKDQHLSKKIQIKKNMKIEIAISKDSNNQHLSKKIQIKKNMKIEIAISKDSNNFKSSFTSFINFLGNYTQALISILNNTIQVNAGNVHMLENKSFVIKSKHSVGTATWESISKKINGISYQTAKEIIENTQNVYSTIARKTIQRLKSAQDRLKKAGQSLKNGQRKFYDIVKKLNESQTMLKMEENMSLRYLKEENHNQTVFSYNVRRFGADFIQRNVVCKIEKCEGECVFMNVCKTCKDPSVLEVPTWKCETKAKQILRNFMSPKQRQCPLTRYTFTAVYTGTCETSPQ